MHFCKDGPVTNEGVEQFQPWLPLVLIVFALKMRRLLGPKTKLTRLC